MMWVNSFAATLAAPRRPRRAGPPSIREKKGAVRKNFQLRPRVIRYQDYTYNGRKKL